MSKFVRKSREERSLEIRSAVLDLFIEKGYKATTMEDIVSSVDLSKGSVYKYYPSKRLILIDLLKDGIHVRNKIIYSHMVNTDMEVDELAEALTEIFYNDQSGGRYAKLYVIFLYEKMFDHDLESIYKEVTEYGMNNTKYVDLLEYQKIMQIASIMNALILGKFILKEEFELFIDKELIKRFFIDLLDKE